MASSILKSSTGRRIDKKDIPIENRHLQIENPQGELMNPNQHCPECGGSMEEGFLLDLSHGSQKPANWVEGAPEKSFWVGTKVKGKEKFPIVAFRCRRCGLLKSYAPSR